MLQGHIFSINNLGLIKSGRRLHTLEESFSFLHLSNFVPMRFELLTSRHLSVVVTFGDGFRNATEAGSGANLANLWRLGSEVTGTNDHRVVFGISVALLDEGTVRQMSK